MKLWKTKNSINDVYESECCNNNVWFLIAYYTLLSSIVVKSLKIHADCLKQ